MSEEYEVTSKGAYIRHHHYKHYTRTNNEAGWLGCWFAERQPALRRWNKQIMRIALKKKKDQTNTDTGTELGLQVDLSACMSSAENQTRHVLCP